MSNQQNDKLMDLARDIVNVKMEANPTIPEEAREQLELEEYRLLCLTEPASVEEEMDDDSGDEDCKELDEIGDEYGN